MQEKIDKQEELIKNQNSDIYDLKMALKLESEKVQSFKDPEGCVQLRILLQDFENNINKITKEKGV